MAGLQADADAFVGVAHAEKLRTADSDASHDPKGDLEAPVLDGIHDGLEFPTEEEKKTLRRVADKIPWNSYRQYLVVTRPLKFAHHIPIQRSRLLSSSNASLTTAPPSSSPTLFSNPFRMAPGPAQAVTMANRVPWAKANGHQPVSRVSREAEISLTRIVSSSHHLQLILVNSAQSLAIYRRLTYFRVYVIPLFGAWVADAYWGRFKTISVAVGIALVGHILLIISSVPGVIENSNGALACFVIAIIIMGVGTGAFKPNISPLVAEQYKKTKLFIRYTSSGEKVIVDPSLTTASIYMASICRPNFDQGIDTLAPVLLSVHQHRCLGWPDWNDVLRKGTGALAPVYEPQVRLLWS